MRSFLVLAGWPGIAPATGAWTGSDAAGRPLVLAYDDGTSVASNEERTIRAVLAGALYNARHLRAGLGDRHAVSARDDAELVVHLYEERGIQCVKALRGAFALALWDERLQRFLLARDQLGLFPLYHASDDGRLAVAAALPQLAALPGVGATRDPSALDAFLTLGTVPPPATFYAGIRQLHPGELAVWEGGRLRTQRYWQPTFPERRVTRSDMQTLVREQTLEALRLRQAGAVAGLLLSGGIDAAALLALATVERRLPARAYTVGEQELRTAAALAARAGVEHVAVPAVEDWLGAVDAVLAAHGGPVGGRETPVLHAAATRAAADVGVLLAGVGGEEVFGGSAPARAAERARRYLALPGLVREAAHVCTRVTPGTWAPALRRLVEDEHLSPVERYAHAVGAVRPFDRSALYTPEMLGVLGDARPWEPLAVLFADAVGAGAVDGADAVYYVELVLGLPARAAAAYAAATAVDLRLPLADHRLVQFVASVPPRARGSAWERQLLLRGAVGDLVPSAVARAPRRTPGPPRAAWPTLIEELLPASRVAAQGFFNCETVARLVREHLRGRRDHGARLWAIMLATRWLERQTVAVAPVVRAAAG